MTVLKTAKDSKNLLAELRSNVDENDEQFLTVIDDLLKPENASQLSKCNPRFKQAVSKCLEKLVKEHKLILDLNGNKKTVNIVYHFLIRSIRSIVSLLQQRSGRIIWTL
jgi:hypothetical protein